MIIIPYMMLIVVATVSGYCPGKCTCSRFKTICSYAKLRGLPDGLTPSTEELTIMRDNITGLRAKMFNASHLTGLKILRLNNTGTLFLENATFKDMTQITVIVITHNRIQNIHFSTFQNLHKLISLDLSFNRIHALKPFTFQGLYSLKRLCVANNMISEFPGNVFRRMKKSKETLPSLNSLRLGKVLDLSNNKIEKIVFGTFNGLSEFEEVNLFGNQLNTLSFKTFSGLTGATNINISRNGIIDISTGAFLGLGNLRILDIDSNLMTVLRKNVFKGLGNLEKLHVSRSKLRQLEKEVFTPLGLLTDLDLQANKIDVLDTDVFVGLSSLRRMNLNKNRINILYKDVFQPLENLTELDMSSNIIDLCEPNMFRGLVKLTELNLENNKIYAIQPGTFNGVQRLLYLNLASNNLRSLESNTFSQLYSLRTLHLRNNGIKNIHRNTFAPLGLLKALDLSFNRITDVISLAFDTLTRLDHLDLAHNENIHTSALQGIQVIKYLGLTIQQSKDKSVRVGLILNKLLQEVHEVQSLKIVGLQKLASKEFPQLNILNLDLARNNLILLEPDTFHGLFKTRTLTLARCKIETIKVGAFRNLHDLKLLLLNFNNIKVLEPGVFLGLRNVENISLDTNSIYRLDEGVFGALEEEICVNLNSEENITSTIDRKMYNFTSNKSRNADLEYFSERFSGLAELRNVTFYLNDISYIHPNTFRDNTKLETLQFSYNPNLRVSADFLMIPSLRHLSASQCDYSNLSASVFKYTPRLSYLDMGGLDVRDLDVEVLKQLPELRTIRFSSPRLCDCHTQQVWQWIRKRHINPGPIKCVDRLESWDIALPALDCSSHYTSQNYTATESIDKNIRFFKMYLEIVILGFILTTGAVGNTLLLVIFALNPEMRKGPNVCIVNLTMGDFLSLVFNLPLSYLDSKYTSWDLGLSMCKIFMFFRDLTVGVTVFSVVALSLQRHEATVRSFQTHKGTCGCRGRVKTLVYVLVVWVLAIGFSLPALYTSTVDTRCLYVDTTAGGEYTQRVWTIQLFVYCIAPVTVIVFVYDQTYRHLKRSIRNIPGETRATAQIRGRVRLANMSVALTVVFCLSYIPNFLLRVLVVWNIIDTRNKAVLYLSFVSYCLFFCNTCFNPIALFCMSTAFRKHFTRYALFWKTNK